MCIIFKCKKFITVKIKCYQVNLRTVVNKLVKNNKTESTYAEKSQLNYLNIVKVF